MEDEREAAVELLESLGMAERLLAERLGERARGLVARGPQQVEVFPVELAAIVWRGEGPYFRPISARPSFVVSSR